MAFKEYKGLDLSKVADEVLSDWEKNKSFEKSISIRRDAPKFIFYEGPHLLTECLVFTMLWLEASKIFFADLKP